MKHHPYAIFLREVRKMRESRGMSQGDVAEILGLSRAQYCGLENGKSMLRMDHVFALSSALTISIRINANARSLENQVSVMDVVS